MKSFLIRAGLFGLIFWLFVTTMLALPSFRFCGNTQAAAGQSVMLCSAFPEGVNPRAARRPPMAIIAGAGQTSLVLTALCLVCLGLGRVLFVAMRHGVIK